MKFVGGDMSIRKRLENRPLLRSRDIDSDGSGSTELRRLLKELLPNLKARTPDSPEWTAEKRAYSVKDAARVYGISRSTLYVLMASGLPSEKVRGRRLIPRDALEALISPPPAAE
jgi:excisionase family DNA binding protein